MEKSKSLQIIAPIVPGHDLTAYIATVNSVAVLTPDQERELSKLYFYDNDVDAARQLVLAG